MSPQPCFSNKPEFVYLHAERKKSMDMH